MKRIRQHSDWEPRSFTLSNLSNVRFSTSHQICYLYLYFYAITFALYNISMSIQIIKTDGKHHVMVEGSLALPFAEYYNFNIKSTLILGPLEIPASHLYYCYTVCVLFVFNGRWNHYSPLSKLALYNSLHLVYQVYIQHINLPIKPALFLEPLSPVPIILHQNTLAKANQTTVGL